MVATLMLAPTKADPITKETKGAGGIKIILAVLWPFSLTCGFGTTGLSLKEKIHAEHCHRPKVFLDVLGGSYGGDWTSYIVWCKAPFSKESPRASGLLYPAKRFCESESPLPLLRSLVIAEQSLISSN